LKNKAVIFDLDGCIANTLPVWITAFIKTFKAFGKNMSEVELMRIGLNRIHETGYEGIDAEKFINKLYDVLKNGIAKAPLHEGMFETISYLHNNGIKLAIVSSARRDQVKDYALSKGIIKYFDHILGFEDTKNNKPHPEPILKAIELLKVHPTDTIMIGDSDVDIIAANQAGVTSVWFHPKINHLHYSPGQFAIHNPKYTISNIKELINIL